MAPQQIPWTKIKALSFDIYGTLIDWDGGKWNAINNTTLGPHINDRGQILALVGKYDNQIQVDHPTKLQRDVITEGLKLAVEELGLVKAGKITQEEVDIATTSYGRQIGSYEAFADTVAAVQRLGKHYKLIPLTNVDNWSFDGALKGSLKEIKFDAVYTAEDIGSYKPSHKNFHYLLDHVKEEFGVDQDTLCHVAQSTHHDHMPAGELKLPYHVWVNRKSKDPDTVPNYKSMNINLVVNTLEELADIVDKAFDNAKKE